MSVRGHHALGVDDAPWPDRGDRHTALLVEVARQFLLQQFREPVRALGFQRVLVVAQKGIGLGIPSHHRCARGVHEALDLVFLGS